MACTVAPRRLSKKLPASPLNSATSGNDASDLRKPCSAQKTSPNDSAPRKAALVPGKVIPPEVPAGTRLPVVIRGGWGGLSTPNSVAPASAGGSGNGDPENPPPKVASPAPQR